MGKSIMKLKAILLSSAAYNQNREVGLYFSAVFGARDGLPTKRSMT
jgi:hypothetical protein